MHRILLVCNPNYITIILFYPKRKHIADIVNIIGHAHRSYKNYSVRYGKFCNLYVYTISLSDRSSLDFLRTPIASFYIKNKINKKEIMVKSSCNFFYIKQF